MSARDDKYDLVVVGGGPAGCSAAITTARAGFKVLLLEKGRYPRQKVCGEFVSSESLNLLNSLVSGGTLLRQCPDIDHARIFVDSCVIQSVIDPPAMSINRLELDFALWQSAQRAGVDTRQQVAAAGILEREAFVVSSSTGEFFSRAVIDASGRWSTLNSTLSIESARSKRWIGLKAHFAEVAPSQSVDLYFFEAGYCGVQPVGTSVENGTKYVNVCAMVPPQCATDLQTVFSLNPALQERSRNWQQAIETVTTAPLIFRAPQANRNHVLLAGDAAGFVDPFVGDGISLALRSGSLAAESLLPFLRGECAMSAAIDAYSTAYARSIAPVFRSSSQLRRLFSLPKPARTAVLALLRNAPSLVRYAVRNTR